MAATRAVPPDGRSRARPSAAAAAPSDGDPSPWRLARLAPLVLGLWFALDLGLRMLPLEWFELRPLVIASSRPGRHSSYAPNIELVARYRAGDAASEANLPATERRAPLTFSTDSLGFRRNPFVPAGAPVDVLFLLGRSFLAGAALSDAETLPAAFSRLSGLTAYNAARVGGDPVNNLRELDWLLERLPGSPSAAILTILEDDRPALPAADGSMLARLANRWPVLQGPAPYAMAITAWLQDAQRSFSRWWQLSPLRVLTTRLIKTLHDDRMLPNEGERSGRQLILPDGRPMLFRRYEIAPARRGRTAADARRLADYVKWWRDELARRGMETWVLVLPSRYTIYGPWLETGDFRERVHRVEEYVGQVNQEIRSRGIRTVNALPVYQASVPQELQTGELLFYREDNHWNARGVELIAGVLADSLRNDRRSDSRAPDPDRARTATL